MSACSMTVDFGLVTSERSGVGAEARAIREKQTQLTQELFDSVWSSRALRTATSKLAEVGKEASVEGWDGYGGMPVADSTVRKAFVFLLNLPPGLPMPDIAADPQGYILLEWYVEPRRVLTVSVSGSGDLHYSALFGKSTSYGREVQRSDGLPESILANLQRLLPDRSLAE